ncbi:MAG: hypothetical protein QM723_22320 [Myxococcaceae bacterium]
MKTVFRIVVAAAAVLAATASASDEDGAGTLGDVCLSRDGRTVYAVFYGGGESGIQNLISLDVATGKRSEKDMNGYSEPAITAADYEKLRASCVPMRPVALAGLGLTGSLSALSDEGSAAHLDGVPDGEAAFSFTHPFQLDLKSGEQAVKSERLDVCDQGQDHVSVHAYATAKPGPVMFEIVYPRRNNRYDSSWNEMKLSVWPKGPGAAAHKETAGTSLAIPGKRLNRVGPSYLELGKRLRAAGRLDAAASYLAAANWWNQAPWIPEACTSARRCSRSAISPIWPWRSSRSCCRSTAATTPT